MNERKTPNIIGLILAAGKGSRMKSDLPKVLHKIAGRTLIERVYDTLDEAGIRDKCVVLGKDIEPFTAFLQDHQEAVVCIQKNPKGTGDAVAAAMAGFQATKVPPYTEAEVFRGDLKDAEYCLICYGDTPCLPASMLQDFIDDSLKAGVDMALIAMEHPEPTGYGRVVTDDRGDFQAIVEEKDASPDQKTISLCNTGIVFAKKSVLNEALHLINDQNAQGEYYLTDCFSVAKRQGHRVGVFATDEYRYFGGVNTQAQLAELEQWAEPRGTQP